MKNLIYPLHLEALKEKLIVAFMMFVFDAIGKFEVIEQMFSTLVAGFRAAYNHMNAVYKKYDVDFCTKMVQEADTARDIAFRKFRDTVKMFITFPETEAKTTAAEIIVKVMDMYGGSRIPYQGINEKTASIANFVEDLEEKYRPEVETLGVSNLLAALKAAQDDFSEKYMARAECKSDQAKGEMAEARRRVSEAYRDLVTSVNIAAKSDSEGVLTDFINLMNVEVSSYRVYTGQGQVGSTSGSVEDGEGSVLFKNATFEFIGGNSQKFRLEVGAPMPVVPNTEGYVWKPEVMEFMPNRNIIFKEVPLVEAEATATFHYLDHSEEEIRQVVGSLLKAPANTPGCHWFPAVPATMPAVDTSYYEQQVSQDGGNTGGTGGGSNTGGGSTEGGGNTGSGTGNENTGGTPPEEDDPNMPPPGSGGSGFE